MQETIQPIFNDKILEFIENLIDRAKIKINGEYQYFEKFKVLREHDKTIRIYFYIEEEVGVIEEAQLLTNLDEILIIKDYELEKALDGLVLTFAFRIEIIEENLGFIE